jgi:pimeloyl-ACP methyl ester carboxylesterase
MSRRVRTVDVGGLELSITEQPSDTPSAKPPVVLLHGFPHNGYTWRHHIDAKAGAGHPVISPDQRGYGWSDAPEPVDAYGIFDLVGDVIGLLDAEGIERCLLVGHDWGSIVAWHVALMRSDRLAGVVLMSVPYQPRTDRSVVDHIRATDPDGPFSYILAFQEVGLAESLMDPDPIEFLRSTHWKQSAAWASTPEAAADLAPAGLPPHLGAAELENYGRAFARSGFRGGVNWYRNFQSNWERTRPWHGAPIPIPAAFIGGDHDFVVSRADGGLGSAVADMADHCVDDRGTTIVPGGHWAHQEHPDPVNRALLAFFASVCGDS